jgi:parvulin-like peptidyl-prolyl isomerase
VPLRCWSVGVIAMSGVLLACGPGAQSFALKVGGETGVGYTQAELGALTGGQRRLLGVLTAFGLAVATDSLDGILRPFQVEAEQDSQLVALAAEVEVRQLGLTDADLRRLYLQHPQYQLTVRHLVILSNEADPPAKRAEARSRAESALRRIRGGESFAQVASQVSEEPGAAATGGLLPPGRQGSWVKEFWQAASALKEGDVSGVVESPYGFHVLKLERRDTVPFSEVRSTLVAQLAAKRGNAGAAQQWANGQAVGLEVEADSVQTYRKGLAPSGTVLARWPGGAYRAGEFSDYLLTLDAATQARLAALDDVAYRRVVGVAARNALLASRATAMGVVLDSAQRGAIRKAGRDMVTGWAQALGFEPGASVGSVKRAAMQALTNPGQGAAIAREAVAALAPWLLRRYPVRAPGQGVR